MRYGLRETSDDLSGEISERMRLAASSIIEQIAIGLAFDRDIELSIKLGISSFIPDKSGYLAVFMGNKGPTILVNEDGVCATAIEKLSSFGRHPEIHLPNTEWSRATLRASISRTGSLQDAKAMVEEVLFSSTGISREAIVRLRQWKDLFAANAYRWVTLASMLLEVDRSEIKRTIKLGGVRQRFVVTEYVNLVSAMGAMTCLACAGPDNSWLAEIALELPWTTWSPSLVLSRERSFLGALQGAAAAAAFGPQMIDGYFQRLARVDSPLLIFDAVLGLVSIANRYKEFAGAVMENLSNELEARNTRSMEMAQMLKALTRSAQMVIETPDIASRFLNEWINNEVNSTDAVQDDWRKEDKLLAMIGSGIDSTRSIGGLFPVMLAIPLFDHEKPDCFFLSDAHAKSVRKYVKFSNLRNSLMHSDRDIISMGSENFH
jgi:hypothetical protein